LSAAPGRPILGVSLAWFPLSILRLWKKDGTDWKIAAPFSRPHDLSNTATPQAK